MKLLTPLLAVGLLLIAGCSEEGPLQGNMPDPVLVLGTSSATSNNVMVPFSWEGVETFVVVQIPPPLPLILQLHGEGVATLLGNSTFDGPLQGWDEGVTTAQLTFTAANGDELETSLEGFTSQPDPEGNITFFGDWTVTGGSGRFRNGTGSGTYFGSGNAAVAPVPISFDGEISLPRGRNPRISL